MPKDTQKKDKLFEDLLRSLSLKAFETVIDSGVRDLDTFLRLDIANLPINSTDIANELIATQNITRQQLFSQSESSQQNTDNENDPSLSCPDLESVARNTNVGEEQDKQLFQSIIVNLSRRSRNVLCRNRIDNLESLLAIRPRELYNFSGAGPKTIAEILNVQSHLKSDPRRCFKKKQSLTDSDIYVPSPAHKNRSSIISAQPNKMLEQDQIDWQQHQKNADKELKSPLKDQQQSNNSQKALANPIELIEQEQLDCYAPASWSVLNSTLLDVLGVPQTARDTVWNASSQVRLNTLRLSGTEWSKLWNIGLFEWDSFDSVLATSLQDLAYSKISSITFRRMLIMSLIILHNTHTSHSIPKPMSLVDTPLLDECGTNDLTTCTISNTHILEHVLEPLLAAKVMPLSDLVSLTERDVFELSGLSIKTFRIIAGLWYLKHYDKIHFDKIDSVQDAMELGFDELIRAAVMSTTRKLRDVVILLGRLGIPGRHIWTLDELGTVFDLSRARVGQIANKYLKKLKTLLNNYEFQQFWDVIKHIVLELGGACSTNEMACRLTEKHGWNDLPSDASLAALLKLSEHVDIIDSDTVIIPECKCLNCDAVLLALEDIFEEDKSERSIPFVVDILLHNCSQILKCKSYFSAMSFSESFIQLISQRTENILLEDGAVYCSDTWGARRGSRTQLVEQILRSVARPMHFTEVYKEVKRHLPEGTEFSENNVHHWLGHSENLLLWDRGTFIHSDCVDIPNEPMTAIESWVIDKLNAGVPFISVSGAYAAFEDLCNEHGIVSESALYALLRRSPNTLLCYPRYPQIYLDYTFESRIPAVVALEQFVQDAGREISYSTLRDYALQDLCLKDFQFQQCISQFSNLVRTSRDGFTHLTSHKIDHRKLSELCDHVKKLLHDNEHISIVRVFADKRVTCMMMGIDGPEMLYSLLRLNFSDDLRLTNYPMVRIANISSSKNTSRGVIAEVVHYVKQKKAPCSYDELESKFVETLGYNQRNVYAAAMTDELVRFGKGSLVHIDTLGWNGNKQHSIEEQAQSALIEARQVGKCYALTDRLLDYYQLPELANGIVWTHTLLSQMLVRGGRFGVIGIARNAFVALPNDEGIETFEDLVLNILQTRYEGASDLESFEQDMRDAGIVQKRVTPGMLGDQDKVCITGNLIMLKELYNRA